MWPLSSYQLTPSRPLIYDKYRVFVFSGIIIDSHRSSSYKIQKRRGVIRSHKRYPQSHRKALPPRVISIVVPALYTLYVELQRPKECFAKKDMVLRRVNRGSCMSAHVLLNLLNELGKRDKMRGLPSILSLFRNEFNKFNNTRARMLDSIYHMTNTLKSHFWRKNVIILS